MSNQTPSEPNCTLCELPIGGSDIVEDDKQFCCTGCRDVYNTLGDLDELDTEDIRRARDSSQTDREVPDDHEATFLEVDGMHCATCETFLESAATTIDGVSDASSSYVTDTVRIDHDPDRVSKAALQEEISGLGYSAYSRDDTFRRRRANNWEMGRVAVGVLMGMSVMLQYLVIIYPTYFGGLFYGDRVTEFFESALASSVATPFYVVIAALTTIILAVTGKPILQGAYVSVRTRSPNMDLLVAIAAVSAYLYSTLSIVFGDKHIYYDVTVAIIVIVTVGNYYESSIKQAATERLSDLTSIRVDEARRVRATGEYEDIAVEDLEADDRVVVRAGERIPVDGQIIDGDAAIDEAVVTGESLPVRKTVGDAVVGCSMVTDGAVTVRVGDDATSSLDRISELVWDLQSGSHGIQKLADKLATIFVPVVLALAVLVTGVHLLLGTGVYSLLIGLTVLIVSCPCALGLATPLAVAAGIRDALERSIVVFDDSIFERIRGAETVIFDKTGTLTTGEMTVTETDLETSLLEKASRLEERSSHPVGKAIAAERSGSDGGAAESASDADATADRVDAFDSYRNGVTGIVDGDEIIVGHPDLFRDQGWDVPAHITDRITNSRDTGRIPVAVGCNGTAEGVIVVGDELRPTWDETVASISDDGKDVVVLTGDDARAAQQFREHDAIDDVFAGVPPEGKAETVKRFNNTGRTVMVGDGTNDAPALAAADLGIALGGGTAMAADAADVALVDDDLASVDTVFELARATNRRVKGNIAWAFCYNAIAIPLAILNLLNPLFAALAMAGSSLLVVTNSTRPLLSDDQ
ncbi:cation-translocating P-type ATPase [Natrinema sp. J7-2]|uniref:heavy metal translocating P-type ATPase n=1 Tax=Natrinema sp. (strain J7-2) TaxID=406552 RepID=UPI00026D4C0C|nr:cation-translocating P-type ATPase [Natrinema sp. J7-2]AFO59313.1 heavy metal translocating P-type ATPase [Natrinema sp. J7-2]